MTQVRLDRRNHDARFDCRESDAARRQPHPRIDDDPFVQDAIQDVHLRGLARWLSLKQSHIGCWERRVQARTPSH
jgi:hypothetical protein